MAKRNNILKSNIGWIIIALVLIVLAGWKLGYFNPEEPDNGNGADPTYLPKCTLLSFGTEGDCSPGYQIYFVPGGPGKWCKPLNSNCDSIAGYEPDENGYQVTFCPLCHLYLTADAPCVCNQDTMTTVTIAEYFNCAPKIYGCEDVTGPD